LGKEESSPSSPNGSSWSVLFGSAAVYNGDFEEFQSFLMALLHALAIPSLVLIVVSLVVGYLLPRWLVPSVIVSDRPSVSTSGQSGLNRWPVGALPTHLEPRDSGRLPGPPSVAADRLHFDRLVSVGQRKRQMLEALGKHIDRERRLHRQSEPPLPAAAR
jgi:hypothetical protein